MSHQNPNQGGAPLAASKGPVGSPADIREHMEVLASDGTKVGRVDHVQGDHIRLTKNDSPDGQHHLIPISWVAKVHDHIHLNRNHREVQAGWQTEGTVSAGSAGADPRRGMPWDRAGSAFSSNRAGQTSTGGAGLGALAGAVAGAVATTAMSAVTGAIYAQEGRLDRWREDWARGGRFEHEAAASKAAEFLGYDLTREQEKAAGTALHYGVGVGSAAIYGAFRHHIPVPSAIRGLGFGAALWLLLDEGAMPALGVTPGPKAFPRATHARGLAGHLVYGLVTEGVLAAVDRWLPGRSR
ncbi:hypothetical protein OJF2_70270 [Aquisphaera giovannonii]|uniref:DUF2171 domain-containing protein n=1 Tax=Aquisphaera giovannonii TaxID=406548 RepID=A0A5B9WCU1_9BACT|nr:DUF1440 domain-containing protein [Aquisphaera giovannonii]QEH38426.1 hypothetical protein OJF2_70270 [Aquisphaera giovannonii]